MALGMLSLIEQPGDERFLLIHSVDLAVEEGRADRANNPLKRAPHTMHAVAADVWERAYTREQAAFPAPWTREHKFWPSVARIDNVYGDRHLFCSCIPLSQPTSA